MLRGRALPTISQKWSTSPGLPLSVAQGLHLNWLNKGHREKQESNDYLPWGRIIYLRKVIYLRTQDKMHYPTLLVKSILRTFLVLCFYMIPIYQALSWILCMIPESQNKLLGKKKMHTFFLSSFLLLKLPNILLSSQNILMIMCWP